MARTPPAPVPPPPVPTTGAGWAIFAWGVGGVSLVLLNPIIRLSGHPIEALSNGLSPTQWAVAALWLVFMMYSEAYRGFHKQFAPRVVVRALALAADPKPLPVVLAPLMCMGLLYANRKRKIVAWSLLTMIVVLVILVRQLDQPWRGIVDLGVVAGLASGLGSVWWFALGAVRGQPPAVPADLPDHVTVPAAP